MFKRLALWVVLFAALPSTAETLHLTLVGTNDLHGWIVPHVVRLPGGDSIAQGGAATFAGYLKILRAQNPKGTLLLDAGDLFQGTLVSNTTEGASVVEIMNQLGYVASAVGNHEFDYGPVGPVSVATKPGEDPLGALKARVREAKFPFLAANLYDAATHQRPAWLENDGTLLVDVAGVKVGIVGLTTPTTPEVTQPLNVKSLEFSSLAFEALTAARRLRARGANVVVALTHAGGKCRWWNNPNDLSTCDFKGEVFQLLQTLPKGTLDAVVAGHTHASLGQFIQGTPVIETPGMGEYFGTIDLYVDRQTRKVVPGLTQVHPAIPICAQVDEATQTCEPKRLPQNQPLHLTRTTFQGKPVTPDAHVQRLVERALSRVEARQRQSLGVWVPKRLSRAYESESSLGDVVTDALVHLEHADVALFNSGGLRANLPEGDLTYGALYEAVPFDNGIATLQLSGEELQRLLKTAYGGPKGVFQQSGLVVFLSKCPGRGRFKSASLRDGEPIVSWRQYKVVLPDFLARGGDGLGPFMESIPRERVDMGERRSRNLRDSLAGFWQQEKLPLFAPRPGRFVFVDDGSSCGSAARMDLQAETR